MPTLRWLGLGFGLLVGCSEPGPPPTVIQRIPLIGGEPDTATRGVVGLLASNSSGCTGSLIAPNLVLTARHCVANISNNNGVVQCGVTTFGPAFSPGSFTVTPDDNLRNGITAGSEYRVQRVVTTPGNAVCGNDVALLVLSSNVASASAPLLVPRVDDAVTTNENFDAVGYGITNPNDTQGATFGQRLRVDDLSVLCVGSGCTNLGGSRTEWGAITPVCGGDSGGPALDSQGRVIGVASRGNAECESALYGAVASWRDLIVDTAIDASTTGGYPPPGWTGGTEMDGGTPDGGAPDSGAPDGGAPDSGAPDSGTPDSGTPDSGAPDGGNPQPDAGGTIGERCFGTCAGGLSCYRQNDDESGICVPYCQSDAECPVRYLCSGRLGVCIPRVPDTGDDDSSGDSSGGSADDGGGGGCGCRAAAGPDSRGVLVFAFLMIGAAARRRRRALG